MSPKGGNVSGVYEIDGLNCYEAHVRQMIPGDELRYGWALAPDGKEYQHNWILRNGEILDYFEWADHRDLGRRYVPDGRERNHDEG
jgi:hypothetical protein